MSDQYAERALDLMRDEVRDGLARLAAVEAERAEITELWKSETDRAEALRAELDEAQRALEAVLPWFEESDSPGATEMAETIRAALPVPARTEETT